MLKIFYYKISMEHIFETVYPEYKNFKEKINNFHTVNDFIIKFENMKNYEILIIVDLENPIFSGKIEKQNEVNSCFNFSGRKFHIEILTNMCKNVFTTREPRINKLFGTFTFPTKKYSCLLLPYEYFLNFINFMDIRFDTLIPCKNRADFQDLYGNKLINIPRESWIHQNNISQRKPTVNYIFLLNSNKKKNKNNSFFNFYMLDKYDELNKSIYVECLETFYEDNADLIERIKERYYSLPQVKKEEEEKNKFEEIQKELIELKNQLKIKDEEISKIKDDLDDKNKLLKKILTKL